MQQNMPKDGVIEALIWTYLVVLAGKNYCIQLEHSQEIYSCCLNMEKHNMASSKSRKSFCSKSILVALLCRVVVVLVLL